MDHCPRCSSSVKNERRKVQARDDEKIAGGSNEAITCPDAWHDAPTKTTHCPRCSSTDPTVRRIVTSKEEDDPGISGDQIPCPHTWHEELPQTD